MQIIDYVTFTYPPELQSKWSKEVFQPSVDHRFTLQLDDGASIEAGVFELAVEGSTEIHACISTQAGCKLGCRMCSSGKAGFSRNLTDTEILTQISLLSEAIGVTTFDHLVYMGIGEPLDNYNNFVASIKELVECNQSYAGKLSFATVGLPKKLKRVRHEDIPPFRMLWVSLHAATEKKRSELMPINSAYDIPTTIGAALEYAQHTPTEVWINYMLFQGFNDTIHDAVSLAALLAGTEKHLSVMLTEPNNDYASYPAGDVSDLERFTNYLENAGVRNKIARFIAAGKQVRAGCGEFIYTP